MAPRRLLYVRTPKNFDGTAVTAHQMADILPFVLSKVNDTYQQRPDLILTAWPEIIGSKLASMTEAVSFADSVLTVKVKNSTLYSLLSQHDKPRILKNLRDRFPKTDITNIVFRIG